MPYHTLANPFKLLSFALSIHAINTPCQHTLSTHPTKPPYQSTLSTHPINPPHQHILSIHFINTPYQHTPSTHPINTLQTHPLNTSYQYTLPFHPLSNPLTNTSNHSFISKTFTYLFPSQFPSLSALDGDVYNATLTDRCLQRATQGRLNSEDDLMSLITQRDEMEINELMLKDTIVDLKTKLSSQQHGKYSFSYRLPIVLPCYHCRSKNQIIVPTTW